MVGWVIHFQQSEFLMCSAVYAQLDKLLNNWKCVNITDLPCRSVNIFYIWQFLDNPQTPLVEFKYKSAINYTFYKYIVHRPY